MSLHCGQLNNSMLANKSTCLVNMRYDQFRQKPVTENSY